ncbi:hypothetical protein HPP92_029053 [Vanilla planifolia]|uniref:Uncharacterized protein n=1 Tax=Vanilla planifolia TaxID=51239 RepID=A0A835P8M0_VANPL|nr:hypothetical protein HPP92_029053 [Vanilla planifolia]KAG0446016.1 hypothetical protein HPP92_029042 [Vanilla planifolia]
MVFDVRASARFRFDRCASPASVILYRICDVAGLHLGHLSNLAVAGANQAPDNHSRRAPFIISRQAT